MPALQTPICNLDLKIGNSIIGEEILGDSDLKHVLEEAQVSITNPIIVIPSIHKYQKRIILDKMSYKISHQLLINVAETLA